MTLGPLEDDVRKRRPARARARSSKLDGRVRRSGSRSLDQPLELREVHRVRLDAQPVPGCLRPDDAVAELLPKRVHVALHELLGGRRRCLPPELIDEAGRRHGFVACSRSTPSSARCFAAPSRTGVRRSRTSSGPRIRNSISPPWIENGSTLSRAQPILHPRSIGTQPRHPSLSAPERKEPGVSKKRLFILTGAVIAALSAGAIGANGRPGGASPFDLVFEGRTRSPETRRSASGTWGDSRRPVPSARGQRHDDRDAREHACGRRGEAAAHLRGRERQRNRARSPAGERARRDGGRGESSRGPATTPSSAAAGCSAASARAAIRPTSSPSPSGARGPAWPTATTRPPTSPSRMSVAKLSRPSGAYVLGIAFSAQEAPGNAVRYLIDVRDRAGSSRPAWARWHRARRRRPSEYGWRRTFAGSASRSRRPIRSATSARCPATWPSAVARATVKTHDTIIASHRQGLRSSC